MFSSCGLFLGLVRFCRRLRVRSGLWSEDRGLGSTVVLKGSVSWGLSILGLTSCMLSSRAIRCPEMVS